MAINFDPTISTQSVTKTSLMKELEDMPQQQQSSLPPLFGFGASVQVSHTVMDLEKEMALLQNENSNVRENSAKTRLASTFDKILSLNQEVSDNTKQALKDASQYSKDLATVNGTIETLNNGITAATQNINTYTQEVNTLTEQLSKATDDDTKAAIQAKLDTANKNLEGAKSTKISLEGKLAEANNLKTDLQTKISNCISTLNNEGAIRSLANSLKMTSSDIINIGKHIEKEERNVEEEKFLDKNDPLRILQDAIAHHDEEFIDSIQDKRENHV